MDPQTYTVKALDDWALDILALPFGGPDNKDAQGEWFAADTQTHEDKWPLPPLVYYHGLDDAGQPTGDPEYIGKTTERRTDDRGVWYRAILDKASELAKRVWDAAQQGIARASSGTAGHLRRVDPDGHIRQWPVVEVSVFEALNGKAPSNRYAIATPAMAKAVYERAGIAWPDTIEAPEATPEVDAQAPTADAESATKTESTEQVAQGVVEMDAQEFKTILDAALTPLAAKLAEVVADVDKIKAEPPETKAAGTVTVTHDEADTIFTSLADECRAVQAYEVTKGRTMHPRLKGLEHVASEEMRATKQTGANEGIPAEGGFLLEPTLTGELLKPLHEVGPFSRMCRRLPVGTNSNSGWINGVDETSRATGARWGGIRGYRLGEGADKTPSQPKFRRINWELKKYAVLVYATDELLQDAAQFSSIVSQGAAEELAFMANDDILTGNGAGGPFGILQAGCLVTVAIEAAQLADTVVLENLEHM